MEYFVNITQKCAFFYINYARMASFAYWVCGISVSMAKCFLQCASAVSVYQIRQVGFIQFT